MIPAHIRVLRRCRRDPSTGCLVFHGSRSEKTGGYGKVTVKVKGKKRPLFAHRVVYAAKHGPIPKGKKVLHRCDNPPCCEDAHLFLGTQKSNVDDMFRKNRESRKLQMDDYGRIRTWLAEGKLQREIAEMLDIHPTTVSLVKTGKLPSATAIKSKLNRVSHRAVYTASGE